MIRSPITTLTSASISLTGNLLRTQGEANKLQNELASGRLADVGIELGSQTRALVSFRQEIVSLQTTVDTNQQVKARLDASQAALGSIVEGANGLLGALLANRNDPSVRGVLVSQAIAAFQSFTEATNTSFAGAHLFAGQSWDQVPMEDYFKTPAPASRSAVGAAFMANFGISSSDPAVQNIPVSSMQAFMDNDFDALFDDAGWAANWTDASVETVSNLISGDRTVQSSVSAQSQAFRKIASAYVLIADMGLDNLNDSASEAVLTEASERLAEGISLMGDLQSVLGITQQQVEGATTSIKLRVDLATEYIGGKEGVDLSELAVRLNGMLNQLEATYAVTARLNKLSLLDAL